MKRKGIIVLIAVVAVTAVFAAVAYAWWTSTSSLDGNSLSTGNMAIDIKGSDGGSIVVTGLVPREAPAFKSLGSIPTLNTQDVAAESTFPGKFFYVRNTGDVDEMFYAWCNVTGDTAIADSVMVRIWLNPSDYPGDISGCWKAPAQYLVWQGKLSEIDTAIKGRDRICTVTPSGTPETLPAGACAAYKIVFWLDSGASPETMGKTVNVTLNVKGGQVEAWPF